MSNDLRAGRRSGRGGRLQLLEAAFVNWRLPGYVGSIAYRIRPFSPPLFDALMDLRFDLRTRDGSGLLSRLRDINGPAEVFGLGEYVHPWIDWSGVEYVLDAGAHVGAFSLWCAARSNARIIALEPNPETRRLLEANVRRRDLDGRIVVRPWALAAVAGRRSLRLAADSPASSFVFDSTAGDLQVEAIDLASAMSTSGFPRFDVVKIDIEGAEHEVFEHAMPATLRSAGVWVVESHLIGGVAGDSVEKALMTAGFELATVPKPLGQKLVIGRRQDKASHQT